MVSLLLKAGVSPQGPEPSKGKDRALSPLHVAVQAGNEDVARLLLDADAPVGVVSPQGKARDTTALPVLPRRCRPCPSLSTAASLG